MTKGFAMTFVVLVTTSLSVTGVAYADTISCGTGCFITANLTHPEAAAGSVVDVNIQSVTPPFGYFPPDSITAADYSVMFDFSPSNVTTQGVFSQQGIVQGDRLGIPPNGSNHAVPVAGVVSPSTPLYLTGGFGSSLTTDIASSGNYFSTGSTGIGGGTASTTIAFTNPEHSFALLWGSIDDENLLTFKNAAGLTIATVDGVEAAKAAETLADGNQGFGGSAYAVIDLTTPFSSVVAQSIQNPNVSFEFAGVAAGSALTVIPEPSFFWLLTGGFGITVAVVVGRRRQTNVLRS